MGYRAKADRAKLFAPFDALKGYREALLEKECIIVPKINLSEEMKEELDWKFQQLHIHDIITVVYYQNQQYVQLTGMIAKISITSRIMYIVNTRLKLDDIYSMEADFFIETVV